MRPAVDKIESTIQAHVNTYLTIGDNFDLAVILTVTV